MTFKAYESSARGGKPTRMFLFSRQSLTWRYAQADRDLTIGGKTYLAAPISRSEIKQTVEPQKDQITITLPYNRDPDGNDPATQSLGDNWYPYAPSDGMTVMCMATHLDDPDQEVVVEWMGIIVQPKFSDGKIELTCQPTSSINRAKYQGAKWQRACWKSVYSQGLRGCNLVADAIEVTDVLTAVTPATIIAAAFAPQDTTYVGGTASWDDNGTPRTANITDENIATNTLTLDDVTGIGNGTAISVTTATGAKSVNATPTAITPKAIAAAKFTQQQRPYASVSWTDGATNYSEEVTAQSGTQLTLQSPPGLTTSTTVTATTNAGPVTISGTVSSVSGSDVTAPEFIQPQLDFAGGTASWSDGGTDYTANISARAGTTLSMLIDQGLTVSTNVTASTTAISVDGTISAIDGLHITASAFSGAPLSLAGGWLSWTRQDGIVEKRSIMAHDDDTVTILYSGTDLDVGTDVHAVPGCEHTWVACEARGNTINFGGAIYKPVQNPYNGRSMSWG